MGACINDDEVLVYVRGMLAPEDRGRVDAHLADCATCCELVAETAKLIETQPAPAHGAPVPEVPAAPSAELAPGTRVGRYAIESLLGRGGMSVVYAAHDPELERRVAIKLLRPDKLGEGADDARARSLREARAMARVSHPNVVSIHDVGVWRDQVFVAMEMVEGHTLRQALRGGRLPWRKRLDHLLAAGRGLCAAHAAGLVHRDFKPENVLVGTDGRVRVTDFGLAKPARGDDERAPRGRAPSLDVLASITLTGHIAGTPAYMAPEQFLGRAADARADQFAFCVALHEALYGARPFAGRGAEEIAENVLASRLVTTAASNADASEVPEGMRALVVRGLAREPEARHESLALLLTELERLRDAAPESAGVSAGVSAAVTVTPMLVDASSAAARPAGGRKGRIALLAAGVLLAVGLVGAGLASRAARDAERVASTLPPPSADAVDVASTGVPVPAVGVAESAPPVGSGAVGTGAVGTVGTAGVAASGAAGGKARHPGTAGAPRGGPRNDARTGRGPTRTAPSTSATSTSTARRPPSIGDRVENPF